MPCGRRHSRPRAARTRDTRGSRPGCSWHRDSEMLSVHIIHDQDGRILAVADAADIPGPGGMVLHHQPRPRLGQYAVHVTLSEEQREKHALTLIRDLELDPQASPARSAGRAP